MSWCRQQFVKDNQIVLNISPDAVVDLCSLTNQAVAFNGRFGGVATDVFVPIAAVVGIYARENGQGMVFDPEEVDQSPGRFAPRSQQTREAACPQNREVAPASIRAVRSPGYSAQVTPVPGSSAGSNKRTTRCTPETREALSAMTSASADVAIPSR
jgi:stringent starvation protein B